MNKIQDFREAAIPQTKDGLVEFQTLLEDLRNRLSSDQKDWITSLPDEAKLLIDKYFLEADPHCPKDEKEEETPSLEGYLWDYFLPEKMKNLLILIRDIQVEHQIGSSHLADKRISKENLDNHADASLKILIEALETVGSEMAGEIQVLKTKEGALDRKFEDVIHLKNPWQVYRSQFENLVAQMSQLAGTNRLLGETMMTFSLIRSNLERMGYDVRKQNLVFLHKAQESRNLFNGLETNGEIDQVLNWLEGVLDELVSFEGKQEHQVRVLEGWLESLKSFEVPVRVDNGLLITKSIDFKKTTTKWLDYFILPDIIELWEDQETLISRIKHVISQVRGSLSIAQSTEGKPNFNADRQVIDQMLIAIRDNTARSNSLLLHIEEIIKKDFFVSALYDDKEFLKVPLQTTFGGHIRKNDSFEGRLKVIWESILKNVDRKYKDSKPKTHHEELEIALQVIENRSHPPHPDHYHALFLTKNFVGDLFLVPRQDIEDQFGHIVDQWKSGKGRSILLSGGPLCGKSTMAEYLSKTYFPKDTVLLSPNTDLIIEGRKFRTSYDLKEAIDFVRRAIQNTAPLILIDDLNLWRDRKISLVSNVRALMDYLSTQSRKAMVLVTLSDLLMKHLDSRLHFSEGFTNHFDLNVSTQNQIYKALMLRHGASHKVVFGKEESEVFTDRELEKKIQALGKRFDQNLGAVLQAWTFCTQVQSEERIRLVERNVQLNDFLSPAETLVLKHCLVFGRTTELELKSFFSTRFETEVKPAVRKLLNIHILGRDEGGNLIIEDLMKQDVYTLLKYKEVLV